MFIRIKKIKNKEYAYLVENKWLNNSSRQVVKDYLGRVCKPERAKSVIKINHGLDFKEFILDLARQELLNYGFIAEGGVLKSGNVTVDLNELKFTKNKKAIAISLNEGFLCAHTLSQLLNFRPKGNEEEVGMTLAIMLVEAGIKVPKEEFIHVFEKVFK